MLKEVYVRTKKHARHVSYLPTDIKSSWKKEVILLN
jgi:hypothetical protein